MGPTGVPFTRAGLAACVERPVGYCVWLQLTARVALSLPTSHINLATGSMAVVLVIFSVKTAEPITVVVKPIIS